jgi:hypothetical protein
VLLDRRAASVDAFLERHTLRSLDEDRRVQMLRCLELQRHRLLMYTSCGWFFDEISGIETVQVLRYAARVLQLAQALGGDRGLETDFVRRLAAAPSNIPTLRDGAGVWRRHVTPSVTDLPRVAAHFAMAGPSEGYPDPADVHAFRVERVGWASLTAGQTSLAVGRVRVTARVTTESREADVAVLHGSGGEVACRVQTGVDAAALASVRGSLFREVSRCGPAEWPLVLAAHFGGEPYSLDDVFPDERRRLLAYLAVRALASPSSAHDRVNLGPALLDTLRATGSVLPPSVGTEASRALAQVAREHLAALDAGGPIAAAERGIRDVAAQASRLGIALGLEPDEVAARIESALGRVLQTLQAGATTLSVADGLDLLALGVALDARPDLWAAQTAAARLWHAGTAAEREVLAPLMTALGFAPAVFGSSSERG